MTMRKKEQYKGAIIVEFALTIPIFLMLLFAMIEIGWLLHQKQLIDSITKLGARALATGQNSVFSSETLVKNRLKTHGLLFPESLVRAEDRDPQCQSYQPLVSMRVETPIRRLSLLGNPFQLFTHSQTLRAQVTFLKECPKPSPEDL